MTRRTLATLVAAALVMGLWLVLLAVPVPYVRQSPGPTVDVLGEDDEGDEIVEISGTETYPPDSGSLRLTTVLVTQPDRRVTLPSAVSSWLRRDIALLPYEAVYPENTTADEERAQSAAQMVNSQDAAVAAALRALDYELTSYPEITGITPGSPAKDELQVRDRVLAIDGRDIGETQQIFDVMEQVDPGETVRGQVERDGRVRDFAVRTEPAPDDPTRALLGVLVGTGYEFPFTVSLGIDDSIGGPSAGLVFALAVYDTLTPGDLTGGADVAGTGEITADGSVGPIGGIQQKIAGAAESGAELFLVPPANCAEALGSPAADDLRLVRADTLEDAVQAITTYADDPDADLPECPS